MEELVKKVTESAGVTDEQAKTSIETISAYLKEKMPKSFHSQIDNMVNGGKLSEGVKEKLMDTAVDVKEKTKEIFKDVADKTEEVMKNMKDKLDDLFNKKKE